MTRDFSIVNDIAKYMFVPSKLNNILSSIAKMLCSDIN